jgi:hypothetical protein
LLFTSCIVSKKKFDAETARAEKEKAERLAKMSEEEKTAERMKELTEQLEAERHKAKMADVERTAVDYMAENNIDVRLKKFILAGDEDTVKTNISELKKLLDETVSKEIENKFKNAGTQRPQSVQNTASGNITRDEYDKLTPKEKLAYTKSGGTISD